MLKRLLSHLKPRPSLAEIEARRTAALEIYAEARRGHGRRRSAGRQAVAATADALREWGIRTGRIEG